MDAESLAIIEELFGGEGKIPITDPRAYDAMPRSFWRDVKEDIDRYRYNTNIPDLFFELTQLVKATDLRDEEDVYRLLLNPLSYAIIGNVGKEKVFARRKMDFFAENLILIRLLDFHHRDSDVATLKSCSHLMLVNAIEKSEYSEEFLKYVNRFFVVVGRYAGMFTELYYWMNSVLKDYLVSKNFSSRAKTAEKKVAQRFREYRRTHIRKQYQIYDSKISQDFFEKCPVDIEYPRLMIDRAHIRVHSPNYMCYLDDVAATVSRSPIKEDIHIEQMIYSKRILEGQGYSKDEIDSLFPVGLEKDFSFMENRSILSGYRLKDKPKWTRDGNGQAYLWRTEGVTYRFVYVHPSGNGPIRLDMIANVQRIVYNTIVEYCPEIVDAFNDELIEETNFIPLGFEE